MRRDQQQQQLCSRQSAIHTEIYVVVDTTDNREQSKVEGEKGGVLRTFTQDDVERRA